MGNGLVLHNAANSTQRPARSGCSMLCTPRPASASHRRSASPSGNDEKDPFASTRSVQSGWARRTEVSSSSSAPKSRAPTLNFSVVNPCDTRRPAASHIASTPSIHTSPLMGMPSAPSAKGESNRRISPGTSRSIRAVSTANRTAGKCSGTASTSRVPEAATASSARAARRGCSGLRPGMRLHSPTPWRPSGWRAMRNHEGFSVNTPRDVPAGRAKASGR